MSLGSQSREIEEKPSRYRVHTALNFFGQCITNGAHGNENTLSQHVPQTTFFSLDPHSTICHNTFIMDPEQQSKFAIHEAAREGRSMPHYPILILTTLLTMPKPQL